jgi:hypothetical protein
MIINPMKSPLLIHPSQARLAETELLGIPAQTLLILAVCLVIALIGGGVLAGKAARARRSASAQAEGLKVPGRIIAVKRQTAFDRERTRFHVEVKLQYFNAALGREETILYILDRHTRNMPPQISGPGAGITDIGAVGTRHREMQDFRKQLQVQGHSKEHIKNAVMQRAIGQAEERPTELDADGYLILKTPVQVDVYIGNDASGGEKGVHVVF